MFPLINRPNPGGRSEQSSEGSHTGSRRNDPLIVLMVKNFFPFLLLFFLFYPASPVDEDFEAGQGRTTRYFAADHSTLQATDFVLTREQYFTDFEFDPGMTESNASEA